MACVQASSSFTSYLSLDTPPHLCESVFSSVKWDDKGCEHLAAGLPAVWAIGTPDAE